MVKGIVNLCIGNRQEQIFQMKTKEDMIKILNYAIEAKHVVPYYQGIYDNKTHSIDKFESLMRIEDNEGNLYLPKDFLSLAKEKSLYDFLSYQMIEKVFRDFQFLDKMVFINLSALDISSERFNKYFFCCLDNVKNTKNFVVEIIENEKFTNLSFLVKFVNKLRQYDVKIAIDDFGEGYSNFVELISIEPDYIKIDGQIVRNSYKNERSRIVLERIIQLAQELSIQVVAEYVDSLYIQKKVEKLGIEYSQGFYFSKPAPFTALK